MFLIANARMYAVTPAVREAWQRLFDWMAGTSGVPLEYIDHAAPAPLETLWAREDLGGAITRPAGLRGLALLSDDPDRRSTDARIGTARTLLVSLVGNFGSGSGHSVQP